MVRVSLLEALRKLRSAIAYRRHHPLQTSSGNKGKTSIAASERSITPFGLQLFFLFQLFFLC